MLSKFGILCTLILSANLSLAKGISRSAEPDGGTYEVVTPGKATKRTVDTQHKLFQDSPFVAPLAPVEYDPHGGIGLRWTQHYFENPLDMSFIDGVPHIEESKYRRLDNIHKQAAQDINTILALHSGQNKLNDAEADFYDDLGQGPTVYISQSYYQQKWDTKYSGSSGIAAAQSTRDLQNATESLIDLSKEGNNIRSNRIRMFLPVMGSETDQQNMRSSSLMNFAFDVRASIELPVQHFEQNENEQLIEGVFAKMAKAHQITFYKHYQNLIQKYHTLRNYNMDREPDYWNSFYTIELPNHPVSKANGILDGIHAKDISTLIKQKHLMAYTLFRQSLKLQPEILNFGQVPILKAEQLKLLVQNVHPFKDFTVEAILTQSPEVLVFLPAGLNYPIRLQSGQNFTVSIVLAPETHGMLQTAVIISFKEDMMSLMLPVIALISPNKYNIEPVYYTNVNVNEQVTGQIKVKNPSENLTLEIVDVYSTEDYLKLYWPNQVNQVQLGSSAEQKAAKEYIKFLKIEPSSKDSKPKTILSFRFETQEMVDHRAVVQIETSFGDVLRIPFYFIVYPDLLKFTPSIVDFGIVPFRFDAIRIPVSVQIRQGFKDLNILYLSDVLLPIQDKRLDFVMGKWATDPMGNLQIYNQQLKRYEEQKRAVLQKGRLLDVLTVILNPQTYGEINTSLVLVFYDESNEEYRVELPIIGHVLRQNNLLVENNYGTGRPQFTPWANSRPAFTINVKNHHNTTPERQSGVKQPLLKSKKVEERLILYNNLGATLYGIEVIAPSKEIKFSYYTGNQYKHPITKSAILQQGSSLQLGHFNTDMQYFQTTSGHLYFWILVNQSVLLPMYVQISDQNLICSYRPKPLDPIRLQDCGSPLEFEMGDLAENQPHFRHLNITNLGSDMVSLDSIETSGTSEVTITFDSVHPSVAGSPELPLGILLSSDNSRTRIQAQLQPQQTISCTLSIEGTHNAKGPQERSLVIGFNPATYGELRVKFVYNTQKGFVAWRPQPFTPFDKQAGQKPKPIVFDASFEGAVKLQDHSIYLNSTLSKPVLLRSIECDSAYFKIQVVQSIIKSGSEQELVRIKFDPNVFAHQKELTYGVAVAVKNRKDHSQVIQKVTNQENPVSVKVPVTTYNYDRGTVTAQSQFGNAASQSSQGKKSDSQKGQSDRRLEPISVADIAEWRVGQEKVFQQRGRPQSEQVRATLKIQTDKLSEMEYELHAEIVTPRIFAAHQLDFGQVHIGTSAAQSITLTNPFSEPILVSLSLVRATSEIEAELRRLKLESTRNATLLKDNLQESLLLQLNHTRYFCRKVQLKIPAKSNGKSPSWEDFTDDTVVLQKDPPKEKLCFQVNSLLQDYQSEEEFHAHKWLWTQVEEYFRQILLETMVVNDTEGFSKEFLLSQIEMMIEQIVSTPQNAVAVEQQVDFQIYSDLLFSTREAPIAFPDYQEQQKAHQELLDKISFPNILDLYVPVRPWFYRACSVIFYPATKTYQIVSEIFQAQSWAEIVTVTNKNLNDVAALFSFKTQKEMSSRPEDFLLQRKQDKLFKPALTSTNSVQFNHPGLHEAFLLNNGTVGVERNIQSFFLNRDLTEVIELKPNQKRELHNAIIYEPRAFVEAETQHQMMLMIKSDRIGVQTVDLRGGTNAAILDFTRLWRMNASGEFVHVHGNQILLNGLCSQKKEFQRYMEKTSKGHLFNKYEKEFACKSELEISKVINKELFGKSEVNSQLQLYIHLEDVLQAEEQSHDSLGFLSRIKAFFTGTPNSAELGDQQSGAKTFVWKIQFSNIGSTDFIPTKIGFENIKTNEVTCSAGAMTITPCPGLDPIPAQYSGSIQLSLTTDFSAISFRNSLFFESISHVQRFPIQITTELAAIEHVNQAQKSTWLSLTVALLFLTVVLLTFKQAKSMQKRLTIFLHKEEPGTQKRSTGTMETQRVVEAQYKMVADKFKQHNQQFLRELTNLGKTNKQGSAFAEYQKALASKTKQNFQPSQSIISSHSARPKHKTAYEENKVFESNITSEEVEEAKEAPKRDESASNSEHTPRTKKEPKERINFNRLNKKEKRALEQRLKREQQAALQVPEPQQRLVSEMSQESDRSSVRIDSSRDNSQKPANQQTCEIEQPNCTASDEETSAKQEEVAVTQMTAQTQQEADAPFDRSRVRANTNYQGKEVPRKQGLQQSSAQNFKHKRGGSLGGDQQYVSKFVNYHERRPSNTSYSSSQFTKEYVPKNTGYAYQRNKRNAFASTGRDVSSGENNRLRRNSADELNSYDSASENKNESAAEEQKQAPTQELGQLVKLDPEPTEEVTKQPQIEPQDAIIQNTPSPSSPIPSRQQPAPQFQSYQKPVWENYRHKKQNFTYKKVQKAPVVVEQPKIVPVPPIEIVEEKDPSSSSEESNQNAPAKVAEQPVPVSNNFFAAFKSINKMFANNAKTVQTATPRSQPGLIERFGEELSDEDDSPDHFLREANSLFKSRDSDEQEQDHPQFRLFGESIWQDNSRHSSFSNSQQQRDSLYEQEPFPRLQSGNSWNEINQELYRPDPQPQRQMQARQVIQQPLFQFQPLRQYNTMFSESLDTLTKPLTQQPPVSLSRPPVQLPTQQWQQAPARSVWQNEQRNEANNQEEKKDQQANYRLL